jgi:hypothetical protein
MELSGRLICARFISALRDIRHKTAKFRFAVAGSTDSRTSRVLAWAATDATKDPLKTFNQTFEKNFVDLMMVREHLQAQLRNWPNN